MPHAYATLMFTPAVRACQREHGTEHEMDRYRDDNPGFDALGPDEIAFIEARDSVYQACVTETGWPYVQHRGGPAGFLKVLDPRTLAYADYRGNRQYLSAGSLAVNNRVALFLVDYPARRRLKLAGRITLTGVADADPALVARLRPYPYRAAMERIAVIAVEAFDWNCAQHLTPRYSDAQVRALITPLQTRIAELEARLAAQGLDAG